MVVGIVKINPVDGGQIELDGETEGLEPALLPLPVFGGTV